jgi:hypothetical protein
MGTHAADYLITTLSQSITIRREVKLAGIRARFIIKQLPAGTFTFSIKQGETVLKTYSFSSINLSASYGGVSSSFWGDFSLEGEVNLAPGSYTVELSSSGYTFASGSWLAWAKTFSADISGLNPYLDFSESVYYLTLIEERNRGLKYDY